MTFRSATLCTILTMVLLGCERKPELDISLELVGIELYICQMHISNRGREAITIKRININQEMDYPLSAEIKLSPGERVTLPYQVYEWPRPIDIYAETNRGVFRGDYSEMGWPTLAVLAEASRNQQRPSRPIVPAPTPWMRGQKRPASKEMPVSPVDGEYVGDWINLTSGSKCAGAIRIKSHERIDEKYNQPAAEIIATLTTDKVSDLRLNGVSLHGAGSTQVHLDAEDDEATVRIRGKQIGNSLEGQWTLTYRDDSRTVSGEFFFRRD